MVKDLESIVTVVTGIPRSGTSMMMQMLAAGGLPILVDGQRGADQDNPRGYFELERVKSLATDAGWLSEARGKAVKIVSALLPHLPDLPDCRYAVILMEREIGAVLASQRAMLERGGKPSPAGEEPKLRELFPRHLAHVERVLANRAGFSVLKLRYEDAVQTPAVVATAVATFLGGGLDVSAMARSVDPTLRRSG